MKRINDCYCGFEWSQEQKEELKRRGLGIPTYLDHFTYCKQFHRVIYATWIVGRDEAKIDKILDQRFRGLIEAREYCKQLPKVELPDMIGPVSEAELGLF